MCVCVCVCERERDRETETERQRQRESVCVHTGGKVASQMSACFHSRGRGKLLHPQQGEICSTVKEILISAPTSPFSAWNVQEAKEGGERGEGGGRGQG